MILSYEKIFSRARGKIYDPKEITLYENVLNEIYIERLHAALSKPIVRSLFSSINLDDGNKIFDFELEESVDNITDEDFVIEILAIGMAIEWLQPKVDSVLYTAPVIGGKEEKKILDNHSNMIARLDSLKVEQKKIIRDQGYLHNSYINGD